MALPLEGGTMVFIHFWPFMIGYTALWIAVRASDIHDLLNEDLLIQLFT